MPLPDPGTSPVISGLSEPSFDWALLQAQRRSYGTQPNTIVMSPRADASSTLTRIAPAKPATRYFEPYGPRCHWSQYHPEAPPPAKPVLSKEAAEAQVAAKAAAAAEAKAAKAPVAAAVDAKKGKKGKGGKESPSTEPAKAATPKPNSKPGNLGRDWAQENRERAYTIRLEEEKKRKELADARLQRMLQAERKRVRVAFPVGGLVFARPVTRIFPPHQQAQPKLVPFVLFPNQNFSLSLSLSLSHSPTLAVSG